MTQGLRLLGVMLATFCAANLARGGWVRPAIHMGPQRAACRCAAACDNSFRKLSNIGLRPFRDDPKVNAIKSVTMTRKVIANVQRGNSTLITATENFADEEFNIAVAAHDDSRSRR